MPDAPPSSPMPVPVADAVHAVARRHGFSLDAVDRLWHALARGDGRMAQFDHPEFGGPGQWMQGGMTMVSTMFEGRLQRRVADLCEALADIHRQAGAQDAPQGPADAPGGPGGGEPVDEASRAAWWPAGWGRPASSGAQDGVRYAWFPDARRLVIESGGRRTVHDTGDHRIGGVSQHQGGVSGLAFTSQRGTVDLARLPVVADAPPAAGDRPPAAPATVDALDAAEPADRPSPPAPSPFAGSADPGESAPASASRAPEASGAAAIPGAPVPGGPAPASSPSASAVQDPERILDLLERLADLQARGILSAGEFTAKKAELLARL